MPNPIVSEVDQFVGLVYQIRNAFAHDISEPRWDIRGDRYARLYECGGIRVDLTNVDGKYFEYADLGGPDVLFRLYEFASDEIFVT